MYGNAELHRFYSKTTGEYLGDRVFVLNIQIANHDGELNIISEIEHLWDERKPLPDSLLDPIVQRLVK